MGSVGLVCPVCGQRGTLWAHPDWNGDYEVTCVTCDETTDFINGIDNAVHAWNKGKTHLSQPVSH